MSENYYHSLVLTQEENNPPQDGRTLYKGHTFKKAEEAISNPDIEYLPGETYLQIRYVLESGSYSVLRTDTLP